MGKIGKGLYAAAGFTVNSAMIIGSVATFVVKDFVDDSAEAYRYQREHGFLNASFWRS